jgi:dolichol-phosphate mannosyltransferase
MISIVIPIFNEEETIGELYNRLYAAIPKVTEDFEVLFIDDGSSDTSLLLLIDLNRKDKRFKTVQLSKNFGHQPAYSAGLSVAKGDYVVMMDGDLQDPPELIGKMYDKLKENNLDIVFAKRESKKETFVRSILMRGFHSIFKRVLKSEEADNVGNFSIFTKNVKENLLLYGEKNRYLPGIRFHIGFAQDYVLFDRSERYAGTAKMSISKLFSLAMDAIFSFSNFPIRFFLLIGSIGLVISFFGFIYVIISKLSGVAPYGWTSTLFITFLFNSIQITFTGVIGEYVYRIYKEVQNRPLFIIKRVIE